MYGKKEKKARKLPQHFIYLLRQTKNGSFPVKDKKP